MISKKPRAWLWALLLVLVAVLLGSLVWLVGRYEQSRFEDQQEVRAQSVVNEIRDKLSQNAQRIEVLGSGDASTWEVAALQLLAQQSEMLRLERRDTAMRISSAVNSPLLKNMSLQGVFGKFGRENYAAEVDQACAMAARLLAPAYSISYFVPIGDGTGYEVTDMCLPRIQNSKIVGYAVSTYSLEGILKAWGTSRNRLQDEMTFTDADGARLASIGNASRQGELFTVKTILSLQGLNLILGIHSWHSAPYWLANTPTALVLILVLALAAVLTLLYRDTRKRLRTEAKLAREIIQQRKAEEISRMSLERLQKSARLATLGEIASMLSHELNQPLAAIASYASGSLNLLEQDCVDAANSDEIAQIKVALERISTQSERAGLVIKSVHDFVRRREAERALVLPQALFDAVLPLLGLQAKQMSVQLIIKVAPHLPAVWCDKTLIEQVIINLARNGMQAMGMQTIGIQNLGEESHKHEAINIKQRILTLSARASQLGGRSQVEFQVLDRGPGLSPDVCSKLFTPFFTTKMEGMGLGLSLCRTVIEQHGGTLTYTTNTEAPMTGTTFSFKLMTDHAPPT